MQVAETWKQILSNPTDVACNFQHLKEAGASVRISRAVSVGSTLAAHA
jgi:hypothetical protein